MLLHPSPKPKSKVQKWVSFFLSPFFFKHLSSYNVFPVSEQVSVTASVTVINKVIVAGLLWDRWGSVWDLYIFQVKEAQLYLHAEQRVQVIPRQVTQHILPKEGVQTIGPYTILHRKKIKTVINRLSYTNSLSGLVLYSYCSHGDLKQI